MTRLLPVFFVVLALFAGGGCRHTRTGVDCAAMALVPGEVAACRVPGYEDRDFLLGVPASPGASPMAILALHGGGGSKEGFDGLTCPNGDKKSPDCFVATAMRAGYTVVLPDGFANPLGFRSWNHGGDGEGLHCSYACKKGADDVRYLSDLMDYVASIREGLARRFAVVGFSNGAGMGHRLACELSEKVAAVAAVSGANQFALSHVCQPARPVPILQIHGTADKCWPYKGGEADCLVGQDGRYASVEGTIVGTVERPGWSIRRGCAAEVTLSAVPDTDGDGQGTTVRSYQGCSAPLEEMVVSGGGHTWPGGDQYLRASRIGTVSRDFRATDVILSFFRRNQ